MSQNFLQFNSDKTEVLIVSPEHISKHIQLTLNTKTVTENLDVILDNNLSLEHHVERVVQLVFLITSGIYPKSSLFCPSVTQKKSLISSRLDYSNSLFTCLNSRTTEQLQGIQTSAARLLTKTKCFSHITPFLASTALAPSLF